MRYGQPNKNQLKVHNYETKILFAGIRGNAADNIIM